MRLFSNPCLKTASLIVATLRKPFHGKPPPPNTSPRVKVPHVANLRHMAYHDALTGLLNRAYLQHYTQALPSHPDLRLAVLYLDMNHFKTVNDTLGHAGGDDLLIQVSARLKKILRRTDLLIRLGGDEFLIILKNPPSRAAIGRIARRAVQITNKPFLIEGLPILAGPSVGVALYPNNQDTFEDVIRNADVAMLRAKNHSNSGFLFFEPSMHNSSTREHSLQRSFIEAWTKTRPSLRYQPIYRHNTPDIIGYDVTISLPDPMLDALSPARLAHTADRAGLLLELDRKLLQKAFQKARNWPAYQHLSITLHGAHLQGKNLARNIRQALMANAVPPHHVQIGIPVTSMRHAGVALLPELEKIKSSGVRVILDDLDTGLVSVAHLRNRYFDGIRIDFTALIALCDEDTTKSFQAFVAFAETLNLSVTVKNITRNTPIPPTSGKSPLYAMFTEHPHSS